MRAAPRRLLLAAAAALLGALAWGAWFCLKPLEPPRVPFDFTVKSGASLRSVSRALADEGLLREAHTFWLLGRLLGKAGSLQAGTSRVTAPLTPLELLDKLATGDVLPIEIAFVEGTTFRQWMAQLRAHPHVRPTLAGLPEPEVRAALGVREPALEGLFFPDTYRFVAGATDVEILRRAYAEMAGRLARAWDARDPLFILWVGIGDVEKIAIIFVGSFFQLILMIAVVASSVPKEMLETAYTLGAKRLQVIRRVLLPASLPGILDTLRIIVGWAWTYIIVAELVAAESGIGYMIINAQRMLQTGSIIFGILAIGVLGIITDYLFKWLQRWLFPWAS